MTSKLMQMQTRFQQKQMQEKEEKLLRLYENQQQRAIVRVNRGSAGSGGSTTSSMGSCGSTGSTIGGGKVRQMFDERRQKAGVDKSYPLEPLKTRNGVRGSSSDRKSIRTSTRTTSKSTVQKAVTHVSSGKPVVNKRQVVQSLYNNNNGDEPYEEHLYENDYLTGNKNDSHREMECLMNNHNLNDGLDNEEMPRIGFDEVDEPFFTGRLANVGGKLPSETFGEKAFSNGTRKEMNGVMKKDSVVRKESLHSRHAPPRRESVKISKKSVQPTKSISSSASPRNSASSTATSNSSTSKPSLQTPKQKSPSPPPAMTTRAPQNVRPSAKQTPNRSVVERDDLAECKVCGRRFAADRLAVHEDICARAGKKKRRIYDATKHRVAGTELEPYVAVKVGKKGAAAVSRAVPSRQQPQQQAPKKDWRRTHEEFIAAIRAAKEAQAYIAKGGKLSDLPPPPPSSNPDYVQCPHCGRRFNEAAAQRHIPKCANFEFNKPKAGAKPAKGTARR